MKEPESQNKQEIVANAETAGKVAKKGLSRIWILIKSVFAYVILSFASILIFSTIVENKDFSSVNFSVIYFVVWILSGVAGVMLVNARKKNAIFCGVAVFSLISYAMLTTPDTPELTPEQKAERTESIAKIVREEAREAREEAREEVKRKFKEAKRKFEARERAKREAKYDCMLSEYSVSRDIRDEVERRINNPDSFDYISAFYNPGIEIEGKRIIIVHFRAENAFGGVVKSQARVFINPDCSVIKVDFPK